ncbi:MAG: DUF4126 domain-containing protein [Planctomycetota bacterium]|nr:MAG: DUF4126 domain-containing protein [Planctomycetota bacterium]REJ96260.1 MAG: DUF4126 domain-containing protein [Planctomycetota bacterium]REK27417.1 MAG: DUF4126 domain-containing protein [Planctomycetota bacterium]REK36903.1 MAG: DUF4126 domain-containing protein [Planctomycetota bacterium]
MGVVVGIGLAAACGFRVFVPMLGTSVASLSGYLDLAPEFDWIGTPVAAVCFGVAVVLEIAAYYIPWLDNLLDTIATPAAAIAGTIMTASMVVEMSPFLKWSLALIAGGGVAGTIQSGTSLMRGLSSMTTAGSANPVFATIEWISSLIMTILAVVLPILAGMIAVALVIAAFIVFLKFWRIWRNRRTVTSAAGEPVR